MKRKLLFSISFLLLIGLLAACNSDNEDSGDSSSEKEEEFLTIGTASLGGNFFPMGTALGLAMEEGMDDVKVNAQATGGSSYNITALEENEIDIGLSQSVSIDSAMNGTGTFEEPITSIATILNFHPTPSHVIVKKDSNIKSFEDLKGKKLEMLAIGDGNEANAKQLLDALGIDWDEIDPVYSGNRVEAASSLKTGKVDGIIDAAGVGSSWIVDILGDGDEFDFISLSESEIQSVTDKYPAFSPMEIPADTYLGQKEDIETVSNWTTIVVREGMDEELAYMITKSILEQIPFLAERHAYLESLNPETASQNAIAPLHPGAERYFKDIGALD